MGIRGTVYVHGRRSTSASFADALEACREADKLAWIDLFEPGGEDLEPVADGIGLDPKVLEGAVGFPRRAKVQKHGNLLVAVLPVVGALVGDSAGGEVGFGPDTGDWLLAIAVEDRNLIVTGTEGERSVQDQLRRRLEQEPDRLAGGSKAVLFEMVDEVVLGYEGAVEAIEQGTLDSEIAVLESRSGNGLPRIHKLASRTVGLQQAVKPLAAALEHLNENGGSGARGHLPHTLHRVLRVTERLDGSADRLSSLLNVYLAMVGQKISAWGAILIVPTLIAGVFGMNFSREWWTRAENGFEVMIGVMLLVSGLLYLWFRRSGWL